ncbi:DUF397 domain-containing protein [Streptomyces sp. NBC_00264]|uniref:DUF397 domain-containing protein n=1 Tax=unclassified Streptomyces TaxID=2593676 RepID=UPI002255F97A|nr:MULTISPECIES: DUF397 domain-containing protein [unclassified Streptomyces]MCX5161164.1 DUF397 domain-containing protein [Streptomyces sp. NBC_00305]MCX5219687.1 DUF397 domain-containing protein [Streptomyces sp. NBC_00264]WSG51691.1 DUF397 domain-containing protein [Streptomyces sp. NBC_01732]
MSSTPHWFKSSYSDSGGGNCIEVAFDWHKSSYSAANGGDCIEVATCPHSVHIRDSKMPEGPTFAVAPDAWTTFLTWAD